MNLNTTLGVIMDAACLLTVFVYFPLANWRGRRKDEIDKRRKLCLNTDMSNYLEIDIMKLESIDIEITNTP